MLNLQHSTTNTHRAMNYAIHGKISKLQRPLLHRVSFSVRQSRSVMRGKERFTLDTLLLSVFRLISIRLQGPTRNDWLHMFSSRHFGMGLAKMTSQDERPMVCDLTCSPIRPPCASTQPARPIAVAHGQNSGGLQTQHLLVSTGSGRFNSPGFSLALICNTLQN